MIDQSQKENVKNLLNKDSLFRHYHIEDKGDGKNIRCCFGIHDDNNASLSVKDTQDGFMFNCFSCGSKGDAFSFIAKKEGLDLKADFKDIMEIAKTITGVSDKKIKYDVSLMKFKTDDERSIEKVKQEYLLKKGVNLENFSEITYIKNDDGSFDFAYPMKNVFGEVVGHQTGAKRVVAGSNCGFFFQNIDPMKPIVILEGLSDYLSALSSGLHISHNIIGIYSVAVKNEFINQLLDNFYTNYGGKGEITTIFDWDGYDKSGIAKSISSGYQGAKKSINFSLNYSGENETSFKFVSTKERKDVNDIFREKGASGVEDFVKNAPKTNLEDVFHIMDKRKKKTMVPLMTSLKINKIYDIASENGNMWKCSSGIWQKMLKDEPEKFVKDFLRFNTNIPAENGTISKITQQLHQEGTIKGRELLQALTRSEEYYARHKNFIFLEDFRYNVITGETLPYQPEDYIYSTLEGTTDFMDAECPRFMRFLDEIFDGDEDKQDRINFMQELYGYCLYPHTPFEKIFIWVGSGGNGKGVLMETLGSLVGSKNRKNLEISRLEVDKFSISELVGCYVNSCSEEKKGMNLGSPILKMLTGGDTLTASRKFSTDIDYKPFCKVIISLNDDPSMTDDAAWLERRLMLMRFNNNFDNWQKGRRGDPELKLNLKREISGIRRWAIEGLSRLLLSGKFTEPKSVKDDTNTFIRRNTRILQFFNRKLKNLILDCGSNVKVIAMQDCYNLYKQYCDQCHGGPTKYAYSYETFITKFEKFISPFAEIEYEGSTENAIFYKDRMNAYFYRKNSPVSEGEELETMLSGKVF